MSNLLEAPKFKIEDRKQILERVHEALIASPDCRLDFRGPWKKLTPSEADNWEARQTISSLLVNF